MMSPIYKDNYRLTSSSGLPIGYCQIVDSDKSSLEPISTIYKENISKRIDNLQHRETFEKNTTHGDIVFVSLNGKIRIILSRKIIHNTVLVTENCNNLCQFCSQPPRVENDRWRFESLAYSLAAFNSSELIGITGGEPFYSNNIFDLLKYVNHKSGNTKFHILTNGRCFHLIDNVSQLENSYSKNKILLGIPVYCNTSDIHDDLVGACGAFEETLLGIINLGNAGYAIEIRFIPTKMNYQRILSTINLIENSAVGIQQYSIMDLEPTGYAKRNWNSISLDDSEKNKFFDIVAHLLPKQKVRLFNFRRCEIPSSLLRYTVKSISDWKNYFPRECADCSAQPDCCGYFASEVGKFFKTPSPIKI